MSFIVVLMFSLIHIWATKCKIIPTLVTFYMLYRAKSHKIPTLVAFTRFLKHKAVTWLLEVALFR